MASPRRFRRKAEIAAEREAQAEQEQTAREARIVAANTDDAPPTSEIESPRLQTDDLMALVDMDPSELAALMDATVRGGRLEVGDPVTGTITRVGRDTVFIDMGGKSEGQLDREELPDAVVGTEITAYVVHEDAESGVQLSTRLSGDAAAEHLEEAVRTGVPVEGLVVGTNPGGFDVRIGDVRAFCPRSMISRLPGTAAEDFVGQTLPFRVIEHEKGRTVVSRRVLQEEEVAERAESLWLELEVGQQHRGIVRNVQPFGFFVDIGGIDGLVPRREISWTNADPTDAVRIGQKVEVAVLEIDHAAKRLTLSARALEDDPWNEVARQFREGGVYPGTVVKIEPFGAFVELAPGITGLAHVSKLAGGTPERGSSLHVRVLSVDHERRRLALAPVAEGAADLADAAPTSLDGVVAEVLRNGVVVQLDDGRTGWLPATEVELEPGTMLAQRFRRGRKITGRLVRDDGNRVVLSARADPEAEQRAWRTHQSTSGASSSAFGTLGDLLSGIDLKS